MRPDHPREAIALARLREQVEAFLAEEAGLEIGLRPRPDLLEAGFGTEDGGAAALDLGGAKLRGRIDRIDLAPAGTQALVRDYKTGRKMPGRRTWEGKGKLQLQLYLLAARESLGLEPVGGLYYALGEYDDRRPRGMMLADEPAIGDLAEHLVGGDSCGPEDFEAELDRARDQASEQAATMRAGDIDRRPLGGKCPSYCTFQPICRLERALGLEAEGEGAENGS
jgi:ATP-dependent helicase/DNAse subunit B